MAESIISAPGESKEGNIGNFAIKTSVFEEKDGEGRNIIIFDNQTREVYQTMIGIFPGFHAFIDLAGKYKVIIECKSDGILEIGYY